MFVCDYYKEEVLLSCSHLLVAVFVIIVNTLDCYISYSCFNNIFSPPEFPLLLIA